MGAEETGHCPLQTASVRIPHLRQVFQHSIGLRSNVGSKSHNDLLLFVLEIKCITSL